MRLLLSAIALGFVTVLIVGFTSALPPESHGEAPPGPGEVIEKPPAPPPWKALQWHPSNQPNVCDGWDDAPVPGHTCESWLAFIWALRNGEVGEGSGAPGSGGAGDRLRVGSPVVLGALLDGLTVEEFNAIADRLNVSDRALLGAIAEGTGEPFDIPCTWITWQGEGMGWSCETLPSDYDLTCSGLDHTGGLMTGCTVRARASAQTAEELPPILRQAYECAWALEQGLRKEPCTLDNLIGSAP